MTDPDLACLARSARRTLTEARTATLLVEGLGPVEPGWAQVLLDDHDGRPRLVCAPGSAVAAAAAMRCPAILTVCSPLWAPAQASVILSGHLAIVDRRDRDAVEVAVEVIELQLVSVIVEIDDPGGTAVIARHIPLEQYGVCSIPSLESAAETMRVHTNARHAPRLRASVSAYSGRPIGSILQARLATVEPTGADLAWIDTDGARCVRLRFPRVATDRRELAALLRSALFDATADETPAR